MKTLDPLPQAIIDKTIDNLTRKLIGGVRNKRNSPKNGSKPGIKTNIENTIDASNIKNVMEVSNRGVSWKEMIQKSISHGISSIGTLKFDGVFTIKNGEAQGLNNVPKKPGVYVVYDKTNTPCYVGDAEKLQRRWVAGHLNENKQKQLNGGYYKLHNEFSEGCTVKYLVCESKETAAAIEAHLISTGEFRVNSKEELKNKQGIRSNIEAKKMKDASSSTKSLINGAAIEGVKHVAWSGFEKLISTMLKLLKDELVDIFKGGKSTLLERIKRFFNKVWLVIKDMLNKPLDLLKGLFEFIVNAFSEVIRKVYDLARNIFDLGVAAYNLYKGKNTMSREQLIYNISETIIISSNLILWESLDAIIEIKLTPFTAGFSPYIASTISAMGFGVSSHYMCDFVPKIVEKILDFEPGHIKANKERILACEQIIKNSEMNMKLVNGLKSYALSTAELCSDLLDHTKELNSVSISIKKNDTLSDVNSILGLS